MYHPSFGEGLLTDELPPSILQPHEYEYKTISYNPNLTDEAFKRKSNKIKSRIKRKKSIAGYSPRT
jgi:hypothetical protein